MNRILMSVGVASALCLVGCGATPGEKSASEEQGEVASPLLTIKLDSGQQVEFFDVGAAIAVSESANKGTPSLLEARSLIGASPEQIFNSLQPGKPLPQELKQVIDRLASQHAPELAAEPGQVGAAPQQPEHAQFFGESEDLGRSQQAYTHTQFVNGGGCETNYPNLQFSDCRRWTGNGYWAAYYSRYAYYNTAWGSGGSVSQKVTLNQSVWYETVGVGQWKSWYAAWVGGGTVLQGIEVVNASGDTFSNGSAFWN